MAVNPVFFSSNLWLQGLSPGALRLLAAKGTLRRLANGEIWVSRTQQAGGIALIVEGGLRSTTFTEDGREFVFSIMRKGDIWGLVSTIDGIHNANDVYAHGDTVIVTIDRGTTLDGMQAHPDFSRCLMNILCHRLRMANKVAEDRALQPIEVRLARLLLGLRAVDGPAAGSSDIEVTQEMLSKLLGCTRPTVNRKLHELEQSGIVESAYGRIRIVDLPRMIALSGQNDYFYF